MSLDLLQNILIYLLILLSILSFSLTIRVSRMTKWTKNVNRHFFKLKYEINKLQKANNQILKDIDSPNRILTWTEEEEKHKEQRQIHKTLKKIKHKERLDKLAHIIPQGLDAKLGQKIIDKLGIITFLIGIALFINVSMELDWINNYGRLFFGVLLTLILLLSGYLIRNKFFQYSNILIGGGIAAFIFSIFASYYHYHIIPLWIWYFAIIITIASSIITAVTVKRQEIVLITFISSYLAPFTVPFLKSDYILLFSYLTLLNISVFVYDFFQKSILINLLSFGFTFITYGIWLISIIYFQNAEVPFIGAFLFLTLFYIIFLLIVIINNVREGQKFHNMEFSIMMTAKAIYLAVGLMIINKTELEFQGLFAGLIGIINYSFFLALYRVKKFDRRILNVFLSLSIMFFALIIPFEFYSKTLTIMWALQAAVLMFVAVRAKHQPMHLSSFLLTLGMFGSLFFDFYQHYFDTNVFYEISKPFFNLYFLGSLIVMASSISILILIPKDKEFFVKNFLKAKTYKTILGIFIGIVFYFSFYLELKSYSLLKFPTRQTSEVFMSIFNFGILTLISIAALFKKHKILAIASVASSLLCAILFFAYYSKIYINFRYEYLMNTAIDATIYKIQYLPLIMILISLFISIFRVSSITQKNLIVFFISSLLTVSFVFVSSSMLTNLVVTNKFVPNVLINDLIRNSRTFNYSILWSFVSIAILVIGFVNKSEQTRLVALLLLIVTLAKVILYDYWTVSNEDMMVTLIIIGLCMLISSFLFYYLKNKDINQQIK